MIIRKYFPRQNNALVETRNGNERHGNGIVDQAAGDGEHSVHADEHRFARCV